jgi:heme oxygenase (biliverdin-IX-beta and delta-forming)
MMSDISLRQRLQMETRTFHDQMEQSSLFKKISLKQITYDEYRLLLTNFYRFIVPCEAIITSLPCKAVIEQREKKGLLEEDLEALGVVESTYLTLPRCSHLPRLSQPEEVLGYLYVMEGATLGGQVITRLLQKQLPITTDHGGKFFFGYGKRTKEMWNNFCVILNNVNDSTQQQVITSACLTYATLYQWMELDSFSLEDHTDNTAI